MLLEKIRRFGFTGSVTQSKNAHKFENGLGPKIHTWFGKELARIAEENSVIDGSGKPMAFTTADLLHQNPDCADTTVSALLDKRSSRQVMSQVALLGRLRSIFSKHTEDEIKAKVEMASKQSSKLGDVWEKRPSWWASEHNFLILQRLNSHGFLNVLSDSKGFGPAGLVSCTLASASSTVDETLF